MTITDGSSSPAPSTEAGQAETYLGPGAAFPVDLAVMSTAELHILNSRICRQREREYLSLTGPHSQTEDRFHQLQAALDRRQSQRSRR